MPGDNDQRSPCEPRSWPEGSGPKQGAYIYNPGQYTLTCYDVSLLLDSENVNTPNSHTTIYRSIGRRAAFFPTSAQARRNQLTRGTKCYKD